MTDAIAALAAASRRLRTQVPDDALLRSWQTRSTVWAASCDDAGVDVLLDAFDACLSHCDRAARLIVFPPHAEAVAAAAARRGIGPHVQCVDAAPAVRKAALLAADALVVCGSDGAIVLDAWALGTPVTGTDSGLDARAGGDAALLWPAHEHAAELIASTVERLRADASLRALLRARGNMRLSRLVAAGGSPA